MRARLQKLPNEGAADQGVEPLGRFDKRRQFEACEACGNMPSVGATRPKVVGHPTKILENDTVWKRKKQSDSIELRKTLRKEAESGESQPVGAGGERKQEAERRVFNRIKHKSLILAQDERWRRA